MRKYLSLSFFLFIINVLAFSQTSSTFNIVEEIGIGASAYNVVEIANEFYIQYIFVDSTGNQGLGIIKINKYGTELKRKQFIDSAFYYASFPFRSVIATSDSFIVLVASRVHQYSNKIDGEIIKLNRNLDIIWCKSINHPDTVEASLSGAIIRIKNHIIKEIQGGGYTLFCNYNKECLDPSTNTNAIIINLDTSGNTQWINRNSNITRIARDLNISYDSGYYIPAPLGALPFKLAKFDELGNYMWSVSANTQPTQTYAIASCEYDSANAIMATYYKYDLPNNRHAISISKINTITKSIEWNKDFILSKDLFSLSMVASMEVDVNKHGSIYISTTANYLNYTPWTSLTQKAVVLKLNSLGDSIWTNYYGFGNYHVNDTELQDLLLLEDGSLVGVGFCIDGLDHKQRVWFFKTEIDGYLGLENIKDKGLNYIVYPNPATEIVTLKFHKETKNKLTLKIYDILGKEVKNIELPKAIKSHAINLNGFASGIYFYELRANNGIRSSGKFVVE